MFLGSASGGAGGGKSKFLEAVISKEVEAQASTVGSEATSVNPKC
jgi:hypothetical protein